MARIKPRVLLLNPPGRKNYCRDGYLSGVMEEGLLLPPQDLVVLSGTLSAAADLRVVDALAERLSPETALSRIRAYSPDHVLFLISAASYSEDVKFLESLRARLPKARIIGLGDVYREIKELAFPLHPSLDAILLDFSTRDVLSAIGGGRDRSDNVMFRMGDRLTKGTERHHYGEWAPPAPRWELFPLSRYRWPFSGAGNGATLSTDFGCPYICTYCPAGSLAHKYRDVRAVVAEARTLRDLGVRHVFFRDQTFGAHPGRTAELLERLIEADLGLSWTCTTRVDLVDESLLGRMKAAGCVAVCYGIDSGDDELLRAYKKNTTRRQAAEAVLQTRRCGLKAWGVFVIGLGMDTPATMEETVRFSAELPLDHRSIRVESQRFASGYRRDMLVRGLVPPEAMPPDTPTRISVWQGRLGVSNEDVFERFTRSARGLPAPSRAARS